MVLTFENEPRTFDEAMIGYSTGHLSPAKHIIIACHSEISETAAETLDVCDAIASLALDDVKPVSMSAKFMKSILDSLPEQDCPVQDNFKVNSVTPKTLRNILGHDLRDVKWKSFMPGVAVHDILGNRHYDGADRLYLLRAKGGMKIPEHGHNGEEWSLILSGSYHVDDKTYERGDLHIEDETHYHAPHVNDEDDCICLIMSQGPLVMKKIFPKIIQKVVGI